MARAAGARLEQDAEGEGEGKVAGLTAVGVEVQVAGVGGERALGGRSRLATSMVKAGHLYELQYEFAAE
ncbi:hypothetical protein [Streptomyces massasporeus]|uniref:hypothetical protein n=1 Tax=Streptomyces massasporeus TaxID=67324 RepID=UPI00331FE88A